MPKSTKPKSTAKRGPKLAPLAPSCAAKHPALHKNRHVNEHITFCALHTQQARNPRLCKAKRLEHKRAANMHMAEALDHMRVPV